MTARAGSRTRVTTKARKTGSARPALDAAVPFNTRRTGAAMGGVPIIGHLVTGGSAG
ncbi:hypothetical protein [Streptosporangium roseum]|uniref:hypothetical protein n=1 Tax=Streptosporangium roseum TaxID=2001 RepID=UPI0001A3EF2E|nr:hypothetical protein [Streptosporangium roseum]